MKDQLKLGEHLKRKTVTGDRLFEPVRDLLIILSALAHASSLMADGSVHKMPRPVMRLGTRWPDYSLAIPLRGPLENALADKQPTYIEIGITSDIAENAKELPDAKLRTGGLQAVMAHISAPIFLMFFERYNDWLNAAYGRDSTEKWPATLNFARVIRNACAHGAITFRNPNANSVKWRDLTYSPADNGKPIIGTDLKLGEILALMFDASDTLDGLGVPVLHSHELPRTSVAAV